MLRQPPARLYLLGAPYVTWEEEPLSFARRQMRALLYVLAASARGISRDELCYLFWAEIPDQIARRNLTRLLTHLRRSFPHPDLILTDDDLVRLDPQLAWTDSGEFTRLYGLPDDAPSAPRLRQAAELYRGAFLNGFNLSNSREFDAWLGQQRQLYERRYLEILSALIETCLQQGHLQQAAVYARRYLQIDDLAEAIHRRLIEILAAQGDRAGALHQYERCAATLERELGVSPLPETQTAYRSILTGEPAPGMLPPDAGTRAPAASQEAFIAGYEPALAALEAAYQGAAVGQGSLVLVWGESGAGKTHLLEHFSTHADPGVRVLRGCGYADTQGSPYQPILEALRPWLDSPAMAALDVTWLTELSRLLPELRARYPELPAAMQLEPGQVKSRLADALCACLLALLPEMKPLILLVDDLHLADTATLDWLGYLGRRLSGLPILVIGAYNMESRKAVANLRTGTLRGRVLREIELEGLDLTATALLMEHLVRESGIEANPSSLQKAAADYHRATGGNPFYLIQIIQAILESGRTPGDPLDLEELPLSEMVHKAVDQRLQSLSPIARQVLDAGAVLGPVFDFETIQLTSGRKEIETLDGLDELLARRILVEQGDHYRFHHEILRQMVCRSLSYWRKRLLHRRASEALLKIHPEDAARLIRLLERAEAHGKAAWYAWQAGSAASLVFANTEASAYFNQALALLDLETRHLQKAEAISENWKLRIQVLESRGWIYRLLGDMRSYEADLDEVTRLAAFLGDPTTQAHLRWREAVSHRWFCRYSQARQAAHEGMLLSREVHAPSLEARCLREEGLAIRESGDLGMAQNILERALNAFIVLEDAVFEIHTIGNLSKLFWYMGEANEALKLARRGLVRCQEKSLAYQRRIPLGDLGAALLQAADLPQAALYLKQSLEIARKVNDRSQEIFCLGHLGWLEIQRSQAAPAMRFLKDALALAQRVGSLGEQSWLLSGLAEGQQLGGDPKRAHQSALQALAIARLYQRPYDEIRAQEIVSRLTKSDL